MKRKFIALLLVASLSTSMVLMASDTVKAAEESTNKFTSMQSESRAVTNITLSNDILRLVVDIAGGDIAAYTTGGDLSNPNDDNKRMLYGNSNGEAIKVGDKITFLSKGSTGTSDSVWENTVQNGNSIVSTYTADGITITRTLTLVKSPNSNNVDAIKTDYKFTNTTNTEQDVSFKTMLDTYVGNNDKAPFSVPEIGSFSKGKKLTGDQVPNYWFAYDNLENPTATTKATFPSNSKPDTLLFTKWGGFTYGSWDQTISESSENGDSAVYMYWNNNKLAPNGGSKTITSYYGVSSLNTNVNSDISLSILNGAAATIEANSEGVYPIYDTSAILRNSGDVDLNNVSLDIVIPEQYRDILALDGDYSQTVSLLKTGEESQKALKFKVLGNHYEDKEVSFDVVAKSATTETRTQTQKLTIKANKQRSINASLSGGASVTINPNSNNGYDVYSPQLSIKNISDLAIENLKVKIVLPEGLSLKPTIIQGDQNTENTSIETPDTFTIDSLGANETIDKTYELVVAPGYEDKALTYNIVINGVEGQPDKVLTQTLNVKALTAPVTPEVPTPPTPKPTKPAAESPKTGDTSSLSSIALAMISGIGLVATKKKKKHTPKH